MTDPEPSDPRADDLRASLERLTARIGAACAASGRAASQLTLVAVTKTYPASDIHRLMALGLSDFGENRVAELEEKAAAEPSATWHFLGRMQSRQTGNIAACAAAVHSVDRAKLATRLGRAATQRGRSLEVFVQLSLDGDPDRGGVVEADLPALAETVAATPGLRLAGRMAVPPIGADPTASYQKSAEVAAALQHTHPGATALSAGMSGDLEAAIAAGATHLRIGTALLGRRAGVVG